MKNHIRLMVSGFAVVMVLMIIVIMYSLVRTEAISNTLQQVHLQQNTKSDLIFKMREGQLNRILVLRNLYLLEDPFEVDEERMRFYHFAREVNEARDELLSMVLSAKESEAMDLFIQASVKNGPLQNEIIDLILEGKEVRELNDLLVEAFNAQKKAMITLQNFQVSLSEERQIALDSIINENQQTKIYIVILTIVSLVIAIMMVVYIVLTTMRQNKEIEDERKKFKMLFAKNMDAVVLLRNHKVVEWNQQMEELFKISESSQLFGMELYQLSPLTQENGNPSRNLLQQKLEKAAESSSHKFDWQFENIEGVVFCAEVSLIHIQLSGGELQQVVIRDMTERKQAEKMMIHQANYDFLTGLPNRVLFLDRLETAIIRSQRFSKMFALLFIDLDRFKQVNDSLGHLIGDEILRMVGQRLGNNVRQVDTVARLGGDEFIIILDNIEKIRDVSIIAEDIIKDVSTVYLVDNKEVSIGASIGISIYPTNGKDAETLLSQSDIAMYQAKQTGRNRHHFFTEEVDAASKGRMQFEQDLRLALDKEQFELYYQPVVDDKHQKLVSAEALIRWLHPTDGLILPDDFIPLAEETGVIFELSRWVLDAVCKQLAIWEQSNQPLCTIAINLPSAEHLCGFTKHYVKKITDQYQVSPSRLIFEITEGLMMENTEKSILWLNSLRDLGVHISIDDFGIGYSSLSYLKRYPVDSLKIDRSFIKNIVSDNHNQLLVDTFVSIANSMQLELVAEGVETLEQMKYLQEHQSNCHLIQGDFYSKPLAIADFEHFRDTFNT